MEIERKFLISELPENLNDFTHFQIEQGYLCREPVIRIRRQGDDYFLTYKSEGMMVREEYNLPLTPNAYGHLKPKTDGFLITKKRYCIPYGNYTIELDIFEEQLAPLIMAEVEFPTEEEALSFTPPDWFRKEVTHSPFYHNSYLSQLTAFSKDPD